jgi:hypothetical protein
MSLAIRSSIIETHSGRLRAAKIETRRLTFTVPAYSSASQ